LSYDTDVRIDAGSGELSEVAEVGNITSNIGRMFYAAMPGPFEGGGRYDGTGEPEARGGLTGLSGLLCRDALPFIAAGLDAMRDREVEMRAMEPGNGWGSYGGALQYLQKTYEACERHPNATLCVNW
jgi:hypothetical protein